MAIQIFIANLLEGPFKRPSGLAHYDPDKYNCQNTKIFEVDKIKERGYMNRYDLINI
jgi:hypothetical protein